MAALHVTTRRHCGPFTHALGAALRANTSATTSRCCNARKEQQVRWHCWPFSHAPTAGPCVNTAGAAPWSRIARERWNTCEHHWPFTHPLAATLCVSCWCCWTNGSVLEDHVRTQIACLLQGVSAPSQSGRPVAMQRVPKRGSGTPQTRCNAADLPP